MSRIPRNCDLCLWQDSKHCKQLQLFVLIYFMKEKTMFPAFLLFFQSTDMTNVLVNQCCAEPSEAHAVPTGHPASKRYACLPSVVIWTPAGTIQWYIDSYLLTGCQTFIQPHPTSKNGLKDVLCFSAQSTENQSVNYIFRKCPNLAVKILSGQPMLLLSYQRHLCISLLLINQKLWSRNATDMFEVIYKKYFT